MKKKSKIFLILLSFSILFCQLQYQDLYSMLHNTPSFEQDIKLDYLNVEYLDGLVSSIHWYDDDSTKFTKLFHYNNSELFLISEFRNKNILKEVYFTSHNITERFIKFIFGEKFFTQEKYITEISYNRLKSPISYKIKSTRDEYIGHIIMNYDKNNNLIRETWFQNKKKIKEFVK